MLRTMLLSCTAAATLVAAAGDAKAQGRDQIRIVGSSTVFPFATVVAENFARTSRFPAPVIESTGSGGGIRLFCQGVGPQTPDITNSSRRMTASEFRTCEQNNVQPITEVTIGYDGIVVANSRQGPRLNLTRGQLWQALAQQVPVDGQLQDNPHQTWNQIDPSLPNAPIRIYGPPPTSGTRDAFTELVMQEGCEEVQGVQQLPEAQREEVCTTYREDGAFIEAGENDNLIVQRLQNEPQAVGVFGFSFLDQNRDTLQAAAINGTDATFDNIASGAYPVSRSMFFYVKNAHAQVIPGLLQYVAEFTSQRAWGPQGYLAQRGLIPLPEQIREQERAEATNLRPLTLSELEQPLPTAQQQTGGQGSTGQATGGGAGPSQQQTPQQQTPQQQTPQPQQQQTR